VTNLENNQTVVVRINDRGPFYGNRVLDLSTAAAEELGIEGGAEKVKITPLAMNDVIEDE
jgi:rare lipoprotein A